MNQIATFTLYTLSCIGVCQHVLAEAVDWPKSVIVISSNQRPVSSMDTVSIFAEDYQPDIQILNLDSVTEIEQRLSEGLPTDSAQAQALMEQRISEVGRSQLDAEVRKAYLPLGTMMAYGLNRYPAIIFDRSAVIFGMTDLPMAINRYRQWMSETREGVSDE